MNTHLPNTRHWPFATRSVARALAAAFLLVAGMAPADDLRIENVTVAPRDAKTATVTFDISWEDSWHHGSFHDAAWVFFKVRADDKSGWQPVRLAADKVVNPAGYGQEKGGTPLEFVVPAGDDGFVGMFVRRAADGKGAVAARKVTALWDLTANKGVTREVKVRVEGFGLEMVYVAEGPFFLGSGGKELNRFYRYSGDGEATPPYPVTGAGPIPTGRQEGKLWAVGIAPEDGGRIPASFPDGYPAFYCMKFPHISKAQYAGFLNTLTEPEAKERYYPGYHGTEIKRSGEPSKYAYTASAPDGRCRWLSWADGAAYAAWAGLRPMTELEYEKAIRGPQNPDPRYDAGSSYWGAADVNQGEMERPVSAGSAAARTFAGAHGRGTPVPPADWPRDLDGFVFRGKAPARRYYTVYHMLTSGRININTVQLLRGPNIGWRAARTAPAGDAVVAPVLGRLEPSTVQQVPRLGRPVRTDGFLDEWGKPTLVFNGPADLFPVHNRFVPFDYYGRLLQPWQGPEDMGAKVYLGWDGEALCVAAEVNDDRHFNTKSGKELLNGDALQVGLATPKGVTWNLGLALTKEGVCFHQWEGEGDALLKTVGCAAVRDEKAGVTRYGLRLPLATLGMEPGVEFRLNIVLYDDDDGTGLRHWLQLAPGMAPGLPRAGESVSAPAIAGNAAHYPRFVLAK
jgi:hypothetical protein